MMTLSDRRVSERRGGLLQYYKITIIIITTHPHLHDKQTLWFFRFRVSEAKKLCAALSRDVCYFFGKTNEGRLDDVTRLIKNRNDTKTDRRLSAVSVQLPMAYNNNISFVIITRP